MARAELRDDDPLLAIPPDVYVPRLIGVGLPRNRQVPCPFPTCNTPRRAMPLPTTLARINRVATNRLLGPLARYLPGFAVVSHVGRRSGHSYRTPVNLFRHGDRYVIALTYGAHSQWVRNVMAAAGAEIETRGRHVRLVDPELQRDSTRSLVPKPVRVALRLMNVDEFMVLKPADADRFEQPR